MAQTILVSPPVRKGRKGGIRTVATFQENNRLFIGALPQYDIVPCGLTVLDVQLCYGPDVDAQDKDPVAPEVIDAIGDTFGGYFGVQCFMGPWDNYAELARAGLEQSADRVVEAKLGAWLDAATDTVPTGTYEQVVSQLEQEADANYAGLPVLHMSRADAVIAADEQVIYPDPSFDGRLWTANGTPVVASSSYTEGFIYASGSIGVVQSPISVTQGLNITLNTSLAIAEQAFNLIVDCEYRVAGAITP